MFCLAVSMPCRRAVASKDTQPKPALLASFPAAAVGAALLEAIELWDGGKTSERASEGGGAAFDISPT